MRRIELWAILAFTAACLTSRAQLLDDFPVRLLGPVNEGRPSAPLAPRSLPDHQLEGSTTYHVHGRRVRFHQVRWNPPAPETPRSQPLAGAAPPQPGPRVSPG